MAKKPAADQQPDMLNLKDVTPPKMKGGNPDVVMTPKEALKNPKADAKPAAAKMKAKPAVDGRERTKPSTAVVRRTSTAETPATTASAMMQIIASASRDPNVNPDKMRQMLDIQKDFMAEQARIEFNVSFVAMQNTLPVISKKGEIVVPSKDGKQGYKTPYATFNEISKHVTPVLQKHGFALSFKTDHVNDRLQVTGVLRHVKGHVETSTLSLPLDTSGGKNNVQGVGSSMSYGKRYCAIALLNIITEAPEDHDDDANGGEQRISAAHVKGIRDLLKKHNVPEGSLIAWIAKGVQGLKSLDETPLSMLPDVLQIIPHYKGT